MKVMTVDGVKIDGIASALLAKSEDDLRRWSAFIDFAAGILDVDPEALSLETAYESIPEWDSVMQLRLVMEISDHYGVDIPLEDVPELKTLADFYRFVEK